MLASNLSKIHTFLNVAKLRPDEYWLSLIQKLKITSCLSSFHILQLNSRRKGISTIRNKDQDGAAHDVSSNVNLHPKHNLCDSCLDLIPSTK